LLKKKHTGLAIAIAWPETLCKQAGAWYDGMMNALGVSKNNYYKVGHAAVVLINEQSKSIHYFDFGRYHTPFGYGRVRDEETDHEVKIHTAPIIEGGTIINLSEILEELLNNPSCHGTGYVLGSYTPICFERAYNMAKEMQNQGIIKYGPFVFRGSNCSRFVKKIVLEGQPEINHQITLKIPYTFSPTPKKNVMALKNITKINPSQGFIQSWA